MELPNSEHSPAGKTASCESADNVAQGSGAYVRERVFGFSAVDFICCHNHAAYSKQHMHIYFLFCKELDKKMPDSCMLTRRLVIKTVMSEGENLPVHKFIISMFLTKQSVKK